MAADQRKRRPSSTVAPFGCGNQEQYRAKKREFRPFQFEFNCNSHVSLKWDDNEKMVVAKEEQIGISSRHLAAFGPVSSNAKLADVVTVPKEVFELDDLAEVLTYEGWQSLLTDKDRSFLSQFLPEGFEADEIVQALLGCENFHFGNPFLKWGSSLCLGNFHPDAVVRYEKSFKANKKTYYSELQQYHDNMIKNLHKLKERCGSAKDPESEILKLTSRSRGHAEKIVLPDSNGFSSQKFEANAAHESASSIADDKSYYSDNQKLSVIRDAEIQRRIRNQEFKKDKQEKWSSSPNGIKGLPRPKKAEKSQKASTTSNDGTKYMSYVKISKKQHEELVSSMGQSGPVIQPKNLNRLLGSLDSYNVKPYVMFEQEEQTRIHEHWVNLVRKDLPAMLQKWRRVQLERLQIMGYLCQEMEDKIPLVTEAQNEKFVRPTGVAIANAQNIDGNSRGTLENHPDDKSGTPASVSDSDNSDKPTPSSSPNETSKQSLPLNIDPELDPPSSPNPFTVDDKFDTSSIKKEAPQNSVVNSDKEPDPSSKGNQSFLNSPLNVNAEFRASKTKELDPMDLDSQNNMVSTETLDTLPASEEHVGLTSEVSLGKLQTETLSSVNMWSSASSLEKKLLTGKTDKLDPMDFNSQNNMVSSETLVTFPASEEHVGQTSEASLGKSHIGTQSSVNMWSSVSSVEKKSLTVKTEELDPMDLNSRNNMVSCSASGDHVGQTSEVSLVKSHTKTHSPVSMWSSMGLPESSVGGSTPFASSSKLTVGIPQLVTKQPANLIDLGGFSMENRTSTIKNQQFDSMDLNLKNNQVSSEPHATCSPSVVSLGISHTKTRPSVNMWSSTGPAPFASSNELTAGLPLLVTKQTVSPIDLGVFSVENKTTTTTKNQGFNPMDLNSKNVQISSEIHDACSPSEERVTKTHSPVNNLWPPMGLQGAYGLSHPMTPFTSSGELGVRLPRFPEQPAHLINLGHDLPAGHTKDLLNRHTNHMPFTDSLATKERNEPLLQSLILRDSFHQEQKKTGPVFHPGNVLLEPNQFQSHSSRGELFLNHQTIHDNVFPDNSRYGFQGPPDHFSTLNPREWTNSRGPTQMQSHLSSGGQLNQGWFGNDTSRAVHSHSSWTAPEVPVFSTTSLGSGSGDQSLYSVLSQCNSLQPRTQFNNPVGSTEPMMIHSTSYGQDMGMANPGISITPNPGTPNPVVGLTSPFDYLSGAGGEASGPTLKNPMGWRSLGNPPPSALQDPSGKPFLKPWNP